MARDEFLGNLQLAAGFLSPTVQVNGIRLDTEHLATLLRRSVIWLTPKAVEGFQEEDFEDLPDLERRQLASDVKKFLKIARAVPPDGPATSEQIRDATHVFRSILTTVLPYLEGFRIYAVLRRHAFPDFVKNFAVRVGEDSTGDKSAWIWVIVSDEMAGKKLFARVPEIRRQVSQVLEQNRIDLYPYILFRSQSEQSDLESELEGAEMR